jgi:hypothetical protein
LALESDTWAPKASNSVVKEMPPKKKVTGVSLLRRCEEIIKSFNPTTHSIDSHLMEEIGDTSNVETTPPDLMFVQQVVTGWYREKKVLDCFIKNFYADNGARVARNDMIIFALLAYLSIFRLEELTFAKFKEYSKTEDPSKIGVFVEYLFNKDTLDSVLRDSWMKVIDLTYTEDVIIQNVEKFIPQARKYMEELDGAAAAAAEAERLKEEAKKNGTAGLKQVLKANLTRPVSPKLTRPRPYNIPEPFRITENVEAKEIPSYLNNNTLDSIDQANKERREKINSETRSKYDDSATFKFNETKSKLHIVKKELEEKRAAELDFDASFVHPPPDFSKSNAVTRINKATILREDFLYRKQQSKDAKILKNYEEELRDPVEYFAWQQKNREADHQDKLEKVVMRRELAKQGALDAAAATKTLLDDNKLLAKLMRDQADVIKNKKEVEYELEMLNKQITVSSTIEYRNSAPRAAMNKVQKQKMEEGATIRQSLEEMRIKKEKDDHEAELVQADKIRQLRALNEVHRENIKVFDPTQSSGKGFLDEMSYMEMKERLATVKSKEATKQMNKRDDILEEKKKSAKELERRAQSVLNARKVKAEAFKIYHEDKRKKEMDEAIKVEKHRETAAISLERELAKSRVERQAQAQALIEEQERIKRAQAYLGANAAQVEENREEQLKMAKERAIRSLQKKNKEYAILEAECRAKSRYNRDIVLKTEKAQREAIAKQREDLLKMERKNSTLRIKQEVAHKKATAQTSRVQAERTLKVRQDFNPYAESMRDESIALAKTHEMKLKTLQASTPY